MSGMRETLFNLLVNACLQIGLFAIVTAALSRLIAQTKAKHQHAFYLAVLLLCLALPVVNTFLHARPSAVVEKSTWNILGEAQLADQDLWIWKGHHQARLKLTPRSRTEDVALATWGALFLYQFIRFGRGLGRVYGVRKNARRLSSVEIGVARSTIPPERVALLASSDIANPVTVGIFRPAVILPASLLPVLEQHEMAAIFAHECAHIRRGDFAVHIACEFLSLPVALHPGIRYLMSKISQTRELACDEHAAVQLGDRRFYARTLLRLASLCLQDAHGNAAGLGIFDGDNLEYRIMTLTKKRKSLSRAAMIGLVLAAGITFGSVAMFARATSRQTTGSAAALHSFAGTWHWMFQGRSFATTTLIPSGSGLTGTVTESRVALNDDGGLRKADATDDTTPKKITTAELDGSRLRVKVADGFEFTMALKDSTHAEILPGGAPPNMKPIPLEKAH